MNKLLLLDLDGTVRETASGATFINDPFDQKLIAGAAEAIAKYKAQGWCVTGISNQGGVEAGFKTIGSCLEEQRHTLRLLSHTMNCIYICPGIGEMCWEVSTSGGEVFQRQDGEPGFRKPEPGMIQLAIARTTDSLEESVSECLYVGDREEDMLAAKAADVRFQWAHIWRGDRP
ncbi:MAG TPA: HAD-IIIA family hydrolase [Coleofasciculaceae cyanobacterium]